jgi:hypothetical protein
MCGECGKFYKISSIKCKIFLKNCVRIWEPNTSLCCTTAVHDGSLVVMFFHVSLNCGKKFLFFLKRKDTKMQNILMMLIF